MKNKACSTIFSTVAFILAITTTACEPNEKPTESTSETTTTVSEAITTTSAQTTASTATIPPSTTQTIESSESKIQATTQPQETSEIEGLTQLLTDDDFTFVNDFGDNMDIRDADAIYGYDKLTPEEALKKDEYIICYNDFTYLTKTSGISFNSIDNSFDYENEVFNVEVPEYNYEFLKVKVGDKFEALTVKSVYVDFDYYKGSIYEGELEVSFSGNHTVNGYIIVCDEGEGYIGKGDIILYADAKTWGDIPIVLEQSEIGRLGDVTYSDRENGFFYLSDIHAIWLGNAYEDYENSDFISLMQEGDYQHVTITISGLKMFTRKRSGGNRCSAKIESISLLDE